MRLRETTNIYRTLFFIIGLSTLILACSAENEDDDHAEVSQESTFTNPIMKGADPWVTQKDGYYYFIESRGGGLYVSKSKELTNPTNWKQVWTPEEGAPNAHNIWAPELHYVNGKWYIYFAAQHTQGPPYIHQRSWVLESVSQDPQGEYIEKGMLYTGANFEDKTDNLWAIDVTILQKNKKLYAIWSGKDVNKSTRVAPQNLYIAEMKNPWTIGSERVKISEPSEEWEKGSNHDLNEGPESLKHNGNIFIVYSARESWLRFYQLGLLKLKSADADPMIADNWIKSGPVFQSVNGALGPGHASFTKSPDGTEWWIAYHAKRDTTPGWGNRHVNLKPFTWDEDGTPNFGQPVPPGKEIPQPSGQKQ